MNLTDVRKLQRILRHPRSLILMYTGHLVLYHRWLLHWLIPRSVDMRIPYLTLFASVGPNLLTLANFLFYSGIALILAGSLPIKIWRKSDAHTMLKRTEYANSLRNTVMNMGGEWVYAAIFLYGYGSLFFQLFIGVAMKLNPLLTFVFWFPALLWAYKYLFP